MKKLYELSEIKNIATEVAIDFGIEKLALFGSYARGDQTESSDLDFVIKKGNLKGYIQFCSFVKALEDRFGKHVDVLTYGSLENGLFDESNLNEVVLYER